MTNARDRLLDAIREQLGDDEGYDSLKDVSEHGADAGYPGFSYTSDCVEFYNKHESDIWELARDSADSMGYDNPQALFATFNRKDMLSDPDQFKNLLTWFVLEEIAHEEYP
jgi:hypothetical protein